MGVKILNVIDLISISLNGEAVLTITDELEWDDKNEHLLMLQDKLNRYLAFIESGEIYEKYPRAIDRPIFIQIVARYAPNETALKFIELVRNKLTNEGYGFDFKVFADEDHDKPEG